MTVGSFTVAPAAAAHASVNTHQRTNLQSGFIKNSVNEYSMPIRGHVASFCGMPAPSARDRTEFHWLAPIARLFQEILQPAGAIVSMDLLVGPVEIHVV